MPSRYEHGPEHSPTRLEMHSVRAFASWHVVHRRGWKEANQTIPIQILQQLDSAEEKRSIVSL